MTVIAVSGATGFIGRHFCAAAAAQGVEVRAIVRTELELVSSLQLLRGADAVVHLAARAHRLQEDAGDPESAFRSANVDLTLRIAAAAREASVQRFVFVSSAGVLGRVSPASGFDDAAPMAPHDAYTRSKAEAETRLQSEFGRHLRVAILRPPLVYGPAAPGNFRRLLRAADSPWPLPIGAIETPRSLISVRNLCDAILAAASGPRDPTGAMLVADAEVTGVATLVRTIRQSLRRAPRLLSLPLPIVRGGLGLIGRGGDIDRLTEPFVVRGTQAQRLLDWQPLRNQLDELLWTVQADRAEGLHP